MNQRPIFISRPCRALGGFRLIPALLGLALLLLAMPSLAITLVDNGVTQYVIAKQTGCDATTSSAATDIRTYLQSISGVTLTINSYADLSAVPAKAIVIGNLVTSPTLGLEEVEMRVSGERLILRGGSSLAHRYAVFTFLEEHLGCRYYSPTVEYVPSLTTVTVPNDYDVTRSPSFEYRYLYQVDVTSNNLWCIKNRVNGQIAIDGTHNMYTIVPPATYFSSHPEYYPLKNGVRTYNTTNQWLCFTNPDLPQIIANYVIARMAATNATTIINVGQGDWYDSCGCTACLAAQAEEGGAQSGVMLRCLNAAADIVAQSNPTRKMMTFAYMHTEKPPVTAPRSNLIIRLCHWRYCDLHGIDECDAQDGFRTHLAGWQNLTTPDQLYIWEYGANFNSPCAVWPNLDALIPNMQYYYNHDVRGMYFQGVYWSKGGDLSWLKMYLLAKVLWNKDVNAATVYNDFLTGYYGDAADEMDAYISFLEDRGRALDWHPNGIQCTLDTIRGVLLPDAAMVQAEALYDAAEAAAAAVSQTLYDRVRYDRASLQFMRIYNKQQLARISSPAERLVKLGDNAFHTAAMAFFDIIGNRGCGNEYRSAERSIADLKPSQAGDVVILENDAVKIEVCPGIQGAITKLIDKNTGRQLLMPAALSLDTANYPFNGFYTEVLYQDGGAIFPRVAAASHSLVTDPDGTKHLTVVTDLGIGVWNPTVPTRRLTRTITLPPGSIPSFTVAAKVKNIYIYHPTQEKLEGRVTLGSSSHYTAITATLPDDTTQAITAFPTTLDVKGLAFDNTQYGYRLSLAFSTQLPTTSATISKGTDGTFNTTIAKFYSGTFPLDPDVEIDAMNTTWTLSAITPTPSNAIDVVWKDFRNTSADNDFGSALWKNTGLTGSFNADAVSEKLLNGDCYVEWVFGTNTMQYAFGLSAVNANEGISAFKYGIRTYNVSKKFRAWENNVWVGPEQTDLLNDDVLRIERVGNTVYYKRNGTIFHTSAQTGTMPLMVDSAIYTAGEKNGVYNCRMWAQSYIDAPLVAITSPTGGTVFAPNTPITIEATATPPADGSTITKVEFYRAGTTKLGEDTTSPYSYTWASPTVGTHALSARAYTSNNGNTTSPFTIIRVNKVPTVSLTAPTTGALFTAPASITLEATATDTDGVIDKVEFYAGANKLGEDDTAPYSFEWTEVPSGNYALTAKATDNDGGVTTSTAVNITVNAPPTVSITAPANGTVVVGDSLTITADAADSDGSISKVEFYAGANKLGEDDTAPYSFEWTNIAGGDYTLTAKAIDNAQGETISASVDISVWNTQDVGTVGYAGSAGYDSGVFTVSGSGAGISGTEDGFHFMYRQISGDCTIVARVVTFNPAFSTARAGVMIRETLDAGSREISTLYMKYSVRAYRHARATTDGTTVLANINATVLPNYWLKLVRSGTSYSCYGSSDGSTWTQIGSTVTGISTDPVYIGLAVTAGGNTQLRTATFDNFTITTP